MEAGLNGRAVGRKGGFVYLLFSVNSGLCKIGSTKSPDRRRQKSIIAAHGDTVLNVANVRVEDRFAVETAAHRHFADRRSNGEWFRIGLPEAVEYFHGAIDWIELDLENLATILHAIGRARVGLPAVRSA